MDEALPWIAFWIFASVVAVVVGCNYHDSTQAFIKGGYCEQTDKHGIRTWIKCVESVR